MATMRGKIIRIDRRDGARQACRMRMVFAVLFALALVTQILADDWLRYENARFGYGIDVPADFTWGPESDNGDGRAFRDGATKLAVWGGNVLAADFEAAAAAAEGDAEDEGWTLTYQAITPSWASFSGTMGQRILYARMIALCGGTQYAAFRLEYSAVDLAELDPVVKRLVMSLGPTGDGAGC